MSAGAPTVTALYEAGVVLLGAAGIAKVARPADSATAMRAAGLPVTAAAVRALAGAEVVLAVAALALPGPVPALFVALSYAAFAAFVAVALHRHLPLASCGCFGRPDSPPSWTHVAVNVVAAVGAALWMATGSRSPVAATVAHSGGRGVPLVLGALVAAAMAAAVLTNPLARARAVTSGGGR